MALQYAPLLPTLKPPPTMGTVTSTPPRFSFLISYDRSSVRGSSCFVRLGMPAQAWHESAVMPTRAASDARDLGAQDLVIIAVKAPAMSVVAAQIGPLIGPVTIVLPAMNGVPWWFAQGLEGVGAEPLQSVDPGGAIAQAIPL